MKFVINKDTLTIEENKFYNSGSVDYYEAEVQFDETWNDLTIEAIITKMGENKGISRSPINNKLMLDIQEFGTYTIGFVGYKIENEEKIYQISTVLGVIQYNQGAGEIETENEPIPTPTEWEIYIAQIQEMIDNIEDMDITAEKVGKQTTITITKKDGTIQEVVINDGQDGQDGDDYIITQQDYEEIANIVKEEIDIPTTLAELSEDSTHRLVTDTEKTTWNNKSDFSGSYNDLSNKPTIPDELKDLSDDSTHRTVTDTEKATWNNKAEISDIPDVSNFITKNVNNLVNYTLKTNTGSLIDLEINQTTYVVTLSLKDQDGNVISTDTIDLPLENVVVSGSYDSTNQKIVLTLQSGDTVDIPVGALVSGLQSEITSSNKLDSDLIDDSNSGNKFVTSSQKTAWNNKYEKPSSGIPKTDLADIVQTSLSKADTALQSYTETDPTVPSHVKNITQANITSWNNKSDFSGNYNDLSNKPKINNIELNGNKTLNDLGIQPKGNYVEDSNYVHTDNNYTTTEKNKVTNLENYDATERVIGTYFGMPLYRQVFVITLQEYSNLPNDGGRKLYSTGIAFDRLIRADLSIVYTSSEQVTNLKTYAMHNVSTSNNYDCGAHASRGNGDIAIQIGSSQLSVSKDINLIIEYTKTSDSSN